VEEDKTKITEFYAQTIEEVMRERRRLDRILQERFTKRMAVLFSDVCGFTQYMDTRGDISGRAWIQQHHDLVFPCIENNEGKILAVMGDGIMASFPSSLAAVNAGTAIQRALDEHNARTDATENIHVKVGINAGEILMDDRNIAGDVVNVASRIQAQAGADQILVSKAVYEDIRGSDDVLCRFHDSVQVKGKAKPLDLYRVVWREDDMLAATEPTMRAPEMTPQKKVRAPLRVLQLEVARERDRLKISAHDYLAGEATTIRHYEEMSVSMDLVARRCREIVELLNRANRYGRLTREILVKLRDVGQMFYDEFFTMSVKQKLRETKAEYLRLYLDDQLVHVPWELLHDGHEFLCQRFNMGRLVRTRQAVVGSRRRALGRPLKMLIVADPEGDLKGAYTEGTQLRDHMDQHKDLVNVSLRSGSVTPEFLKEKIRNFDLVHYAGHADYNPDRPEESGWRLTSGTLKPEDVVKMAGTAAMPALIFSNACQSARTEEWSIRENFQGEIFGLANAFLLAGVRHYVGTFWEIPDEPSRRFALDFYAHLLAGSTAGEAVRLARQTLIKAHGEETIVWASYLLYGDPTSLYLEQGEEVEVPREPAREQTPVAEGEIRAPREEVIAFTKETVGAPRQRPWWVAALGGVIVAALLFWGYSFYEKQQLARLEGEARTSYQAGDFQKALEASTNLESKSPEAGLAALIRGHINLRTGNLDRADEWYRKALEASKATKAERAEALVGLGRLASLRKQPDEALKYYGQATELAPESSIGYLSQAMVLEEQGKNDEALSLLEKGRSLAPNDQTIAALTEATRKRVALERDEEKQKQIDRLVAELLETMRSPPRIPPSDAWTSPPLTAWLMDFEVTGYGLQQGEERLILAGVTDQLLQNTRARLVERALLDKLFRELKLGTSQLVDRSTALSLGRMLAARLILSGQVVYSGAQTQISMRIIETETGQITASMSEPFAGAVPPSLLTEKLSGDLVDKLKKLYPLRGKIGEVRGEAVKLNIGQQAGVKAGERFKVVDGDATLEVTSVEPDSSLANVAAGTQLVQTGLRVEAM
jgi:class 3 adenylate cyclase/CHAT domain-containing protein/Tfp pilus assembly protein PilF